MQTRLYNNSDLLNWTRYTERKKKKKLFKRRKPANWVLYTKRKPGLQKLFFDSLIKH